MSEVEDSSVERPESKSQATRFPVWIIIFSLIVAEQSFQWSSRLAFNVTMTVCCPLN